MYHQTAHILLVYSRYYKTKKKISQSTIHFNCELPFTKKGMFDLFPHILKCQSDPWTLIAI